VYYQGNKNGQSIKTGQNSHWVEPRDIKSNFF